MIADGPATETGELALGQNVVVAFMPWGGYNFEDSILINEKLVKNDVFTSIHIEEFECVARDTKLGKEEITRDIPNVGEEALKDLDESGIVRIGAEVKAGDILVGKITPKGETQLSPEEKLLRAIFGERAGDVRDTSLRVPPGRHRRRDRRPRVRTQGHREGRARAGDRGRGERAPHAQQARRGEDHLGGLLQQDARAARRQDHGVAPRRRQGQGPARRRARRSRSRCSTRSRTATGTRSSSTRGDGKIEEQLEQLAAKREEDVFNIEAQYSEKIAKLTKGDELPPGVIKLVKVYLAIKRKLSVGDKMAGRHGNKGVVSRLLPEEDMPYLEDGTPVDIVLNPLGVPSRMNIGQILEVHLGWAAKSLGNQIDAYLETNWSADVLKDKLTKLFPDHAAFIDKLNQEDVGRFAKTLTTRRPPRDAGVRRRERARDQGRAQDGRPPGRRSGSPDRRQDRRAVRQPGHRGRDVHAQAPPPRRRQDPRPQHWPVLARHPAAARWQGAVRRPAPRRDGSLGDGGLRRRVRAAGVPDRQVRRRLGRTRMYESIVKGEHVLEAGLPESFNVLLKELQALCLDVELIEDATVPRRAEQQPPGIPAGLAALAREVADKMGSAG